MDLVSSLVGCRRFWRSRESGAMHLVWLPGVTSCGNDLLKVVLELAVAHSVEGGAVDPSALRVHVPHADRHGRYLMLFELFHKCSLAFVNENCVWIN